MRDCAESSASCSEQELISFIRKWLPKFRDTRTPYAELFDAPFADDCSRLGFEMDCGKAFEKEYPEAFNNLWEFKDAVDEIEDVDLLGSALYSRWRYFNHWNDYGTFEKNDRRWFVFALERLAYLAGEKADATPKRALASLYFESNSICYGPIPEPDDLVEQSLELHADGYVLVIDYVFGEGWPYRMKSEKKYYLEPAVAKKILREAREMFTEKLPREFVTDVGSWGMVEYYT